MSVLVVGLSFRTAPIGLLERAALNEAAVREVAEGLCRTDHVAEAVVLSTCNRLEVYAEVSRFHGGIADIGDQLCAATGIALPELTSHLYVHYEAAAVSHLFAVVCGLDSMAVGEQQILGQVRSALRVGQEMGSAGRSLGGLLQRALHVGKRAHTETDLDHAGHSLVRAALEQAAGLLGSSSEVSTLVVGAGSMSALVVSSLVKAGGYEVSVASRTRQRAERLAQTVGGRTVAITELGAALADFDLVISCTGAAGHVIDLATARAATQARKGRPQVYVDLALPRDIDPDVDTLADTTVIDLEVLGRVLAGAAGTADLDQVRELIAEETAGYVAARQSESVSPTVVALRVLARSVVDAELTRLQGRLGDIDQRIKAEVEQTVHRVVEKLLHTPTVRVKELAMEPGGSSYAEALRELFDLDLDRITAVAGPPIREGVA